MCGFAGLFKSRGGIRSEERVSVARMLSAQTHRGPDGRGLYESGGALLGHMRLAIIDLSPAGQQPMSNHEGNVWTVYNGEIVNFRELRAELERAGHPFQSESDTEVLVHGYECWGITGLLHRLRGMFAFALLDERHPAQPRLFLARDRFGIKPLYVSKRAGTGLRGNAPLLFASELGALMASGILSDDLAPGTLESFLQLGSIPSPRTAFAAAEAVPAGCYLEAVGDDVDLHRYWSPRELTASPVQQPTAGSVSEVFREAVRLHLISDVPLGVFSSGGTDSASLVAMASEHLDRPLTTVSIVFDEAEWDEARFSRLVAEHYGTDHHEVRIDEAHFRAALPLALRAMDQPTIDGINSFVISGAAKDVGLKVVLTGLGGDEVFLGYPYFRRLSRARRLIEIFWSMPSALRHGLIGLGKSVGARAIGRALDKLDYLAEPNPESLYLLFRGLFTPGQIAKLTGEGTGGETGSFFREANHGGDLLRAMAALEFEHYLGNQLLPDTDSMSMAHSIEARVPFLDHRLVETVSQFSPQHRLRGKVNKSMLVGALSTPLPRAIWDRPKQGFTFPFSTWLRSQANELMERSLASGLFEPESVRELWTEFEAGRMHWSRPWALVVFAAWQDGIRDKVSRARSVTSTTCESDTLSGAVTSAGG